MHSPTEPTPFDDGDLYDMMCGNLDYGIDFYVNLARQTRGPILEVCCGTGRVTLPCLQAGAEVEGLDLSKALLDKLRQKASALGFTPPLYEANMTSFRLPRRYAVVMITFNAFCHNLTTEDQLATLTCCREHLLPGGLFVFDGFFPGREYINLPDGTRVLEGEGTLPESNQRYRMFDTRTFDRVEQTQHSRNEFELLDAAGNVTRVYPSQTTIRWTYKHEMGLLLRLAGFPRWTIHGGFDRRPLTKDTDGMIVEAWAAA